MKKNKFYTYFFVVLIAICLSNSLKAQSNNDTVYTPDYRYNLNVYLFVASDQTLDSAYHQRVSKYLLDGQAFYRQWMNHWGYGDRTYGLIKDSAHQLVKLIVIRGAKTLAEYPYSTTSADAMKAEINSYLNANPSDRTDSRMNLVITYCKDHASADVPFYGYGLGWCFAVDYPGMDLQAAAKQTTYVGGMMHELGHGLSLPHNGGIKSVNTLFGTSLMGSGNSTYQRTPTYLTKADCAILNNNQVFAQSVRNDWYASVQDTIKGLRAYYSNGNIIVSGRYTSNSSAPVNYVSFYHQKNETGGDYRSTVWTTPIIGTDSFYLSMAYSEFTNPGDNAYVMTIRLLHENGSIFSRSYAYNVVDGIPQIDIFPAPKVKLTELTNGAAFAKRDELLISATASDEIAVTDVQFIINGQQKAVLVDSPYQWTWNNVTPGRYTVIAKATNTQGFVALDSAVITVVEDSTTLLAPSADAFVRDGSFASSNYGTLGQLTVKKDANTGFSRISYLKFDLSNYTGSLHNVKLQLSLLGGVNGTQWQLWKCDNDNWTETGVNWNNKPAAITLAGSQTSKLSGVVEWDITNLVNTEINGDKILTVAVMSAVAGQTLGADFYSKEATATLVRPKLLINVYPGIAIAQPVNADVFEIGSSTTVKANVGSVNDVPVVTFMLNGQSMSTNTQAPYEWNWNNLQPGTYGIRAKATNSLGLTTLSDSITVRVKDTSGMIEPIADSYVRDGSANVNTNFGTQTGLVVKKDGSGFNRITYLKFDVSDYTKVDTAKLRLTIQSGNTNATVTQWQLWKCDNDNWTETGLNWNNKPATTTLLGTIPGKRSGVAEWNISNIVQAEANGDKILTLCIVGTVVNGTSDVTFYSKETANAAVRPKLIIEAPPVISLLQPLNNDSLIEKSTVLIKAKATDDKKIANVSFFINGEQKAIVTQAPYEWNWTNTAPGSYGIRVKATDNSGISAWSDSVTVIVKDTTAPVVTCAADIVAVYDPTVCGATINYSVTATDNFSTPVVNITNGLASGSVFPLGTTTVTAVATDAAGNTSTCSFTVTVNAITTYSSLNISTSKVQYSDKPVFAARITNGGSNCGSSAAATATFKLGTEVLATVPMQVNGNDLVAVYNDRTFTDAPGTNKTVSVEFTSINEAYVVTNPAAVNFSIVKEDAAAHYSGALFVSTAAANNGSATIHLKATIRDITAETGSALYDAFEGDIRNATATFINRENNTVIAANVPLVLVTNGDTKTAIASYNWNVDIGTANSQSYTIGIVVNNFYTRNSSADNAIVTVSKPLDDFIAGGGNLLLTNSSGTVAGDAGTLNDLGFSLKWNKSKSNLQGYLNTIIRRMENGVLHVYQVKANSMTSMVVDGNISATHPYPTASFGAKANIQDITDPLNPIAIDGNATLQVSMTDGSNYNATDKIAITVWNKNGSMWYSSNWTGVTAEQTINAGDIVISNAVSSNRTMMTAADVSVTNAGNKLSVQAYPNPSAQEFKLNVQTGSDEKVNVKVMDLQGRIIREMQVVAGQNFRFGSELKAGIYFVEVTQGKQSELIKLIKL
ncbi:DNRLRE domain-containing protein [Lacibacter luteus]|uniref:DNRLRE domain-containing protein n=1 Tax=Lacibacter luteus TaxID=2508719 RepID=A0A4Q1CL47_9BACT|nr:DNRLRE domain-containing protein [Lacibacter luteus]RXK61660.1 DNRLRE domain-containing protein [Lacibacter luteus]